MPILGKHSVDIHDFPEIEESFTYFSYISLFSLIHTMVSLLKSFMLPYHLLYVLVFLHLWSLKDEAIGLLNNVLLSWVLLIGMSWICIDIKFLLRI